MKPIAERRAWKTLQKKLDSLHRQESAGLGSEPQFNAYIIEVVAVRARPEFVFYVGQCFGDPEKRLKEHQTGSGIQRAAKMFRHAENAEPQYRPLRLRADLMEDFPSFWQRETAQIAEREIDEVLNAMGFPSHSN
jgi:hypothetical protein